MTGLIHWWETSPGVTDLANFIQITQGAISYVAYALGAYKLYELSCDAHLWCWRHGRHRVGKRHYCVKHHPAPKELD